MTYHTVIDEKFKACALMIFETIEKACQAGPLLIESPVSAVELFDRDSIRSIGNDLDRPDYFQTFPETACILLIEIQANEKYEMSQKSEVVQKQ